MKQYKFGVDRPVWLDSIRIYVGQRIGDKMAMASNMTFTASDPGELREPLMTLTPEEAQELANGLYAAGIHPTQTAGSAGQLDAVKNHLEDMRTLVFREQP